MKEQQLQGEFIGKPIPGTISRSILDAIQNGSVPEKILARYDIKINEVEALKKKYQEKLKEIKIQKNIPRHLIFYQILKEKFPEISWQIKHERIGKPRVDFVLPIIDSGPPSILSMLLDRVRIVEKNNLAKRYLCGQQISSDILRPIENFLNHADALYPNERHLKLLLSWISLLQQGCSGTVLINICPDYAVEPTGDPQRPYKHTFAYLGDSMGQIAIRIAQVLPLFKKLLEDLHIHPNFIVGMADFEAFSQPTLDRVKLIESEFLNKLNKSLRVFKEACSESVPVETISLTELCGGKNQWLTMVDQIKNNFAQNEFGNIMLNNQAFLEIVSRRKALYSRWYGEKNALDAYVPIAMNQAAEYATIGYYATQRFDNCFILGADSALFGDFYSYRQDVPTLYLRRYYY